VEKLAALVPAHGVLAPAARSRPQVAPVISIPIITPC